MNPNDEIANRLRILERHSLPLKGVYIQCLDANRDDIPHATASGFIRREQSAVFLYTCWHVATGIELHPLSVPHRPPSRRYLRITLQGFRPAIADDGETRVGNIIGGVQQADLALYSEDSDDAISIWYQDPQYQKNGDLEAVGIRVPKSFDLIKLPVPDDIEVSDVQVVAEDTLLTTFPVIGDEVLIVGYSYGYSTHGLDQPTPVVLSRRVAAVMSPERPSDILLDGGAARGMSGGPVFLRDDNGLTLLGVYTGLVYADYQRQQRELHTALGSACHGLFGMTPGTPTSLVRADTLF